MENIKSEAGMPTVFTRRRVLTLAAAALPAMPLHAQPAWPDKPLRMLVGYPGGSGIDVAARQLAHRLEVSLHQPIIVDNRPGALGNIAAHAVAQAAGDPYTFLFTPNSTHAANIHLFRSLPFDPVRDFTPVSSVATLGFVLVCDPQALKVATMQELIPMLKQSPKSYAYGSGNATGLVAGAMFKSMLGLDLLGVPYKGVPPAITDLLGGRLQLVFADATLAIPMVHGGKLKALAVTSSTRIDALPGVPTLAESGLPGYDLTGWFAVFMPARVPAPIVASFSAQVRAALADPELAAFLRSIGCDPQPSTPAELANRVAVDTERWGRLVKLAGIEPE